MRYGNIKCVCGKEFYFETLGKKINCISCGKEYDTQGFSLKTEDKQRFADKQAKD